MSEDQAGQKKWAAIKKSIAAFDPALEARDNREEARVGNLDRRFNHWIAVRNGLMNAHADLFPQIPQIVKTLPDPIDQMKLFELIQIIPSPTKSASNQATSPNMKFPSRGSWAICATTACSPSDKPTGARTSANFREILDAMWIFNVKFDQALAKFNEIKDSAQGLRLIAADASAAPLTRRCGRAPAIEVLDHLVDVHHVGVFVMQIEQIDLVAQIERS